MISLETRTRKLPHEVIEQALSFFGPDGYGLEVRQDTGETLFLQGGGGSVGVTVQRDADDRETVVEITAQEWENAAKEFVQRLR